MRTQRTVAVLFGAATLAFTGISSASAAPPSSSCAGGQLDSGTYNNLTISGSCRVADGASVTVRGNVTVRPHAAFNASTQSTLTIRGNVVAGRGSDVSLGCTEAATRATTTSRAPRARTT